jgi:hypothetical protein
MQRFATTPPGAARVPHGRPWRGLSSGAALLLAPFLLLATACTDQTVTAPLDAATERVETGAWEPMGTGFHKTVVSLTVHGGELIAGGYFGGLNYVARWDGSTWHPMGSPALGSAPSALVVHEGVLIAGGDWSTERGQAVDGIARWDGSEWRPMYIGMTGWGAGIGDATVLSFAVHDGHLIAGGSFYAADGRTRNGVARWDGSDWQPMGTLMQQEVKALTVHNGELIAGGTFVGAGGELRSGAARWDGSEWQPMGWVLTSTWVMALTVHNGELFAGGLDCCTHGENTVSRWSGSAWQPVGTGTGGYVTSLAVHDGELVAGGESPNTLGAATNHVARWDGSAWQAIGAGTNGSIIALTVHDGDLIAAGSFTTAGGRSANNIARWVTP